VRSCSAVLEEDWDVELVDRLLLEEDPRLLELLLLLAEHSPNADAFTGRTCRRPGISAV
jgi:hypothetical protein